MGLFGLFRKKISIKDINSNNLVVLSKTGALKFGANLEVMPGFECVLVHHNKVADVFKEGRYRLDTNNMPLLTRFEKLTKQDKKGNLPKKFRADIYYVNLKVFENLKFESIDGVWCKNKVYKDVNFGNLLASVFGEFSFKVTNAIDFMEGLFCKYGLVKDNLAKSEVCDWVAECVAKIIQRKKPSFEMLYSKDERCFEGLVDLLNKELFDVGVKITDAKVSSIEFSKKLLKKLTLSQDKMQEPKQEQYTGEFHDLENPVKDAMSKDFENQSNKVYESEASGIDEDMNAKVLVSNSDGASEVKTGEFVQTEYKSEFEELIEGMSNSNVMNNVDVSLNENKGEEDLTPAEVGFEGENLNQNDFDEPIQKSIEYKVCPICKSYNSKDSSICFKCGHKF